MWAALRIWATQEKNSSLPTGHSRFTHIEAGQIIAPICTHVNSPTKEVYSYKWNSTCHQVTAYSFINQNINYNYFKINSPRDTGFSLVKNVSLIEYKVINIQNIPIIVTTQNQWSKTWRKERIGASVRILPWVPAFIDFVLLAGLAKWYSSNNCVLIKRSEWTNKNNKYDYQHLRSPMCQIQI